MGKWLQIPKAESCWITHHLVWPWLRSSFHLLFQKKNGWSCCIFHNTKIRQRSLPEFWTNQTWGPSGPPLVSRFLKRYGECRMRFAVCRCCQSTEVNVHKTRAHEGRCKVQRRNQIRSMISFAYFLSMKIPRCSSFFGATKIMMV